MNKKTIIFAPLAVLAMGLTSCNKWSTISNDKAKDRINAVLTYVKEEFKDFPKTVVASKTGKTSKTVKNHTLTTESTKSSKCDIENCYSLEESKYTNYAGSEIGKDYSIVKDNVNYDLDALDYTGDKYTYINKDGWQKATKENVISELSEAYSVFYGCESFDDCIKYWDDFNNQQKDKGGYFKYTFVSNNTSKNIGIISEFKLIEDATEYDPKTTTEGKAEVRFENNLPVYMTGSNTISYDAFKEKLAYSEKSEFNATVKYDTKISQDSINLDDYVIKEHKE